MKKKLVSGLSIVLATILMAGCSGGNTATSSTATSSTATNSNTENGKVEEISVMIWDRGTAAPNTTVEDNTLTKYIQEKVLEECNVKVKFVAVPRSGSNDKVNIMMAGGSAPDVVFSYSKTLLGDYASKGGLTDLGPYIEEFGPDLKEQLATTLDAGVIDDKQYAIPSRRPWQQVKHLGYIRKDWIDALGMQLPTTKQELIDILYAFKEKDPGNLGDQLVPWAMGGNQDSEKFYLNFVGSYGRTGVEKDEYLYSDKFKAIQPGTEEGYKVLNQLYNDGIISQDFAVDTNDDKFMQDITNGKAGFFVQDDLSPLDALVTLKENVPSANFIPINAFENPDGEYVNPANPEYGMYIMVPKTSEKKAAAVVKYLNWLAKPENAVDVAFTPEHVTDENGIPTLGELTGDDLKAKGYPGHLTDYCIVTLYWDYYKNGDAIVEQLKEGYPMLNPEFFQAAYDAVTANMYTYPIIQDVLPLDTKYSTNLEKILIEFSYKLISTSKADFDKTYKAEYDKLIQAGLNEVLNEREQYYNEKVAK